MNMSSRASVFPSLFWFKTRFSAPFTGTYLFDPNHQGQNSPHQEQSAVSSYFTNRSINFAFHRVTSDYDTRFFFEKGCTWANLKIFFCLSTRARLQDFPRWRSQHVSHLIFTKSFSSRNPRSIQTTDSPLNSLLFFRTFWVVAARSYKLVFGGSIPCTTPPPRLRPRIQKQPAPVRISQYTRWLLLESLPFQPAPLLTYNGDQLGSLSGGHRQRVVCFDANSAWVGRPSHIGSQIWSRHPDRPNKGLTRNSAQQSHAGSVGRSVRRPAGYDAYQASY